MNKTAYRYKSQINNEPIISQGDIFCNIPQLSYDFLSESTSAKSEIKLNNACEIIENIIKTGSPKLIEMFYNPTWAILASQDCDIRGGKDLIFYPLVYDSSFKLNKILLQIDKRIKNSTRALYLPRIITPNGSFQGPFRIIYHNPFNVPFNIIKKNLNCCWRARLIEPIRKMFVGKVSHFYSRTPMEEILFLENEEINTFINETWNKLFWNIKSKNQNTEEQNKKLFTSIFEINNEFRRMLKSVGRVDDISKIFFLDTILVEKLKPIIEKLNTNNGELLDCIELLILVRKFEENQTNEFFLSIINKIFLNVDSLSNTLTSWFHNNNERINRISNYQEIDNSDNLVPQEFSVDKKKMAQWLSNYRKLSDELQKIQPFIKFYKIFF